MDRSVSADPVPSLPELLRTLRAKQSTCVVRVSDGVRRGEVIFDQGELVEVRALAVVQALKQYRSGEAPIEIEVADSQHPLASNETAEGRSANRRVDLIVLGSSTPI